MHKIWTWIYIYHIKSKQLAYLLKVFFINISKERESLPSPASQCPFDLAFRFPLLGFCNLSTSQPLMGFSSSLLHLLHKPLFEIPLCRERWRGDDMRKWLGGFSSNFKISFFIFSLFLCFTASYVYFLCHCHHHLFHQPPHARTFSQVASRQPGRISRAECRVSERE